MRAPAAAGVERGSSRPPLAAALLAIAFCSCALLAAQAAPAPVSAVDSLGRKIQLAAPARRIVSLSPEATEALFAAGAGSALIADTTYCDYPAAAVGLPKVGGFSAETISIEKILALKPDLVVTGGRLHAQIEATLAKLGIRAFAYEPQSFVDIADCMMALGELAGKKDAGIRAAATLSAAVEKVRTLTATIPSSRRPTVFWQVYDEPLMTCGRNSFAHQIIELAGGRDIFSDLPGPWPVVSSEEVLRRSPAVILGADDMGDRFDAEKMAARPGWSAVPAVRDRRLYLLPADLVSRAGPRIASGLLLVLRDLHPELVP